MRRRTALALCGSVGAASLSGCLGVFDDSPRGNGDPDESAPDTSPPEGYVRPYSEPEVVPTEFRCPDGAFIRPSRWYSPDGLAYGDTEKFALHVSDRSFEYGETADIVLRNVHSERAGTGNPDKHNLEIYTEAGWTEVRRYTNVSTPLPITDELVEHQPCEGFEWEIELTEEGIPAGHINERDLQVCADLVSGRYRFVFGSIDMGVAVEFDLTVE